MDCRYDALQTRRSRAIRGGLLMYGYVYKTTCIPTGLIYVGQHAAKSFEPQKYIGSGKVIKNLIKQYGKNNFSCELLATATTAEELSELEQYWIDKLSTRDPNIGYNISKVKQCCTFYQHKLVKDGICILVSTKDVESYLANGWTTYVWRKQNKEKKAEINKQWYEAHKEQESLKRKKYVEEHKDELSAKKKQYYIEHKAEILKNRAVYYKANKDKILAQQAEHYQQIKDNSNFKNRRKIRSKEYNKNNRAKLAERQRQYRAKHREEVNRKAREYYHDKVQLLEGEY